MKSYTQLINDYQTLTTNTTSQNIAFGTQYLNDSIRTIANMRGGRWPWLELVVNVATVASQEHVIIPANIEKIADLYVTVGSDPTTNVVYMPYAVFDSHRWKLIIASRLGINDNPYFYYVLGNRILIQPIPATDGNTVTFRGRRKIVDINVADYTLGTIGTTTNGDTTVNGATDAFAVNATGVNTFGVNIPIASAFTGDSETTSTVPFVTDASIATQFNTLESGTCADFGITNAKPIVFTGPSHDNYVNGTTYYAGNVSGNTFKVYSNIGLTILVTISVDTSGYTWSTDGGARVTMISPATTALQGLSNGIAMVYTGITGNGLTNGQTYWAGNVTTTKFKLYNDSGLTTATTISGATNPASFDMVLSPIATLTSGTCAGFGIVSGSAVIYTGGTAAGLTNGTTYYAGGVTTSTFVLYNDSGLTTQTTITSNVSAGAFKIAIAGPTLTLTAGTCADYGIINGAAVQYTGTTGNGLTHNTVYYAGNVSGNTFKLYAETALTNFIALTGNLVAAAFNAVLTNWTSAMAGRWIRIDRSPSSEDNWGDEQWYEIASVTSATELELVAPYLGTSIVNGNATYTIGQMSVIPEPYDTAILYRAVALYWQSKDNDKYKQYMLQYDGGYEAGLQQTGPGGLVGQLIETTGESVEGAYIPVDDPSWVDPNVPPRYPLSGFGT